MPVNTINGKITANKETLNLISIAFLDAAKHYTNEGADAIAERFGRVSDEIYRELKESGYYD